MDFHSEPCKIRSLINIFYAKIMSVSSANECYQLGLSVENYDHKHWLTKARKAMYDVHKLKYSQNPKYIELLKMNGLPPGGWI